jgi:hypothetical protein
MATIVNAGSNTVKLDNGKTITANQGGWYDGQQYWGGTLSQKGVINSLSNQVGAGKPVSAEVNAQSAAAQGVSTQQFNTYLATPNAGSPGAPTTSTQVQSSLNEFGSNLFSTASANPTRVQTIDEISSSLKASGLLPSGEAPTAPSLAAEFQKLADAKGVDAIQKSVTELKAQQDAIASQLDVTKTAEKGKPVAQNVISGRISQEQQQAQDQYDFIGRQLARKQDELTSTLGNIQMIMQFEQTDYQNASTRYNQQFDQAISTFNLIRGIQQDQKTDEQRATDNARANLQIMTNAITNGNLDIGSLPPDQIAQLNKLEVQSGLPIGFTQAIKQKLDPKANIVATTTDNGVIQVLVKNPDGTMSLQSYGSKTGGSGSGGGGSDTSLTATQQRSVVAAATKYLGIVDGNKDKLVSLDEYKSAVQQIISSTGVSGATADDYLTRQMQALGYNKWHW